MIVEAIIALTLVFVQGTVFAQDNSTPVGAVISYDNCTLVNATLPTDVPVADDGTFLGDDVLLTCEQQQARKTKKAVVNSRFYWPPGPDGNPLVLYYFVDYLEGCSFPFIFKGINYTACTTAVIGRPWCATSTDVNNNFIGRYKHCDVVDRNDMQEGFDHWMEHTCIKMEETNITNQPHLQVIVGGGCYSYLGRISHLNGQPLSIGHGCSYVSTIVHELGHAIGLIHEQARLDRDEYVEVMWDNITPGRANQFAKEFDNNFGVTYDYSSVMHYQDWEFARKDDYPVLVSKDPMSQQIFAIRRMLTGLSHRDKLLVNRMYKCIDGWLHECGLSSDPCLNDGYTGKDCTCVCAPGTAGSNCEEKIDDYYGHIRSTLNERISTDMTISVKMPTDTAVFAKVITPPMCHRAVLTFTYSYMPFSCRIQRIFVRTNSSDFNDLRLCGDEVFPGLNFTSETEIVITTSNYYNREKKTIWEADVRFQSIPGCSTTSTTPAPTCPPPPTCPMCPTIAPPPRPARVRHCVTGGNNHLSVLPRGSSITITSPMYPKPYPRNRISCGWKLQAKHKGTLSIKCDRFQLNTKDKVRFHVPKVRYFKNQNALSSRPNIMIIKFASRRGNRGPGFKCTVASK